MPRSRERSAEAIEFARTQRQEANEFAWTVWQWIRGRKCHGQKFRREVPIGPYTEDFCCIESKLIIEIDGEPHFTEAGLAKDRVRDRYLQDLGYKVAMMVKHMNAFGSLSWMQSVLRPLNPRPLLP